MHIKVEIKTAKGQYPSNFTKQQITEDVNDRLYSELAKTIAYEKKVIADYNTSHVIADVFVIINPQKFKEYILELFKYHDAPNFWKEIYFYLCNDRMPRNGDQHVKDDIVGKVVDNAITCDCGNQTFFHRHSNWLECTSCNKIKVL